MIQAIGSPTRMSMTVTMRAMLNEFATALTTVFLIPSLFRTRSTRSQSVKRCVTTKIDGTAMTMTNTAHANANHALRTLELPESSSILLSSDKGTPYRQRTAMLTTLLPRRTTFPRRLPSEPSAPDSMVSSSTMFMYSSNPVSLPSNDLPSLRSSEMRLSKEFSSRAAGITISIVHYSPFFCYIDLVDARNLPTGHRD